MDIRLEGLHEEALLKLAQLNNEKAAAGMMRILIRDAAREAKVWPVPQVEGPEPQLEGSQPA